MLPNFPLLNYTVIHIPTSNMWEHPFLYTIFINTMYYQSFESLSVKQDVLKILRSFLSLIVIENFFTFKNHSYFHFYELSIYILAHFSFEGLFFFKRFGDWHTACDTSCYYYSQFACLSLEDFATHDFF